MKNPPPVIGDTVEVEIFKITDFGAFVRLPGKRRGLIHISQISDDYVKDVSAHLKIGDRLQARILQMTDDGKIDLTLKTPKPDSETYPKDKTFKASVFADKIDEFFQGGVK